MAKRVCCRGIIVDENTVLLMYREKKTSKGIQKYYTYPGGGLEPNETLEECVKREIQEEFSLEVEILKHLKTVEYPENITHYFACRKKKGQLTLGGEEKERNHRENYYEVRKIPISKIKDLELYQKELIFESQQIVENQKNENKRKKEM